MTFRLISLSAIAASAALASPSAALEAMRCNIETAPSLFQPVLRIVSQGSMEDILMGQSGLTRSMFYRDADVLAYVADRMDMPRTLMPASVSGQCGSASNKGAFAGGRGGGGAAVVAAVAASPVIETDPEPEDEFDTPDLKSAITAVEEIESEL